MIFGDRVGLKFPDISHLGKKCKNNISETLAIKVLKEATKFTNMYYHSSRTPFSGSSLQKRIKGTGTPHILSRVYCPIY